MLKGYNVKSSQIDTYFGKMSTHDMEQVTSVKASGEGSSESIGILFTPEKRALVKSVKFAIRNLGDDIAQQVYVNPDIRNIAKQNGK